MIDVGTFEFCIVFGEDCDFLSVNAASNLAEMSDIFLGLWWYYNIALYFVRIHDIYFYRLMVGH